MAYKKIAVLLLFVVMVVCNIHAQQIKLPAIYKGDVTATSVGTNIQNMVQPVQLSTVAPKEFALTSLTPRLVKPECIPHGNFGFIKFDAQRQDDGAVKLVFETENEYTNRTLTIERVFANGTENADIAQPSDSSFALFAATNKVTSFVQADSQYARNRGYHKTRYEVTDHNAYTGISFYRVTASNFEDTSNAITEIIAVIGKPLKETLAISPNPLISQANVQLYSKYAGTGLVQFVNTRGAVVKQFLTPISQGNNLLPFTAQGLAQGMYYVRVLRTAHQPLQTTVVKF